jgi:hypothetical protein
VIDGVADRFCKLQLSDCVSCARLNESPLSSALVFVFSVVPSASQPVMEEPYSISVHKEKCLFCLHAHRNREIYFILQNTACT